MTRREDPLDFVVSNFVALEEQLVSCMDYVPFIEQNECVVSPRFVPILMDACSLVDSVFRHTASEDGHHNLRLYALMHEDRLELEEATTLLLVSPLQFLRPFRGWQDAAPQWWNAYNQVKHDRVGNYAAASYAHTVSAMAALHQVMARSWAFLGNLAKAGWFNESDEQFGEMLVSRCAGCGPPAMPVESRLFVSAIRDSFVDWTTDLPTVQYWEFTERVKNYIWEDEDW